MSEDIVKPVQTGENQVMRNPDGTFPKGVSGNPEGRTKGTYSLKTKIINYLKENPEVESKLIEDIVKGEQGLLLQMVDGRPKQSTELTGELNITNDPEHRKAVEEALSETIN